MFDGDRPANHPVRLRQRVRDGGLEHVLGRRAAAVAATTAALDLTGGVGRLVVVGGVSTGVLLVKGWDVWGRLRKIYTEAKVRKRFEGGARTHSRMRRYTLSHFRSSVRCGTG